MVTTVKTSFGTFQSRQGDRVVLRGIKYASLKDQLSVPEMVINYGSGIIDATSFGPRALAMDGCAFEQSTLIQCSIGVPDDAPPMSGTECLNLNITVPDIEIKPGIKLPVMVFIHGGGFLMGANYWPQYDPSRLVKLSAKIGLPVMVVNINYRLGVLGDLTSQEFRDAGYPGNNSLRDQKCAFQWIKAYIEGFGGDPNNVTAFGESAGAAAVLYQLQSEEPLFKRCISMSGTPIMLKALPLPVTEVAYQSIMTDFGLESAPVEERIKRLIGMEPEELVSSTPMTVPLLPHLDGDIVPETTSFAKLANNNGAASAKWCEELMIGDCQHDGNVFLFMGLAQRKAGIANAFRTSLHVNLPEAAAAAVLWEYGLHTTTDDDEAMMLIIEIATDIAYFAPALAYARSFPGKTYYYQFNEQNPWDGPFSGCSTHMLDAAFLFQNFSEHMSPEACRVAEALAMDFVKFANGVQPWDCFEAGEGKVRTYGPGDESVVAVVKNNGFENGRRDILPKLSEEGKVDLDQLSAAWNLFIAGK